MLEQLDFMGFSDTPDSDEYLLSQLAGTPPSYERHGELHYPCCHTVHRQVVEPAHVDELKLLRMAANRGGRLGQIGAKLIRYSGAQKRLIDEHKQSAIHAEYRQGKRLSLSDWEVINRSIDDRSVAVDVPMNNYLYHVYSYIVPNAAASRLSLDKFVATRGSTPGSHPVVMYVDRQYPGIVCCVHLYHGVAMRSVIVTGAEIPEWMYAEGRIDTICLADVSRGIVSIKAARHRHYDDPLSRVRYHSGYLSRYYPVDLSTAFGALMFRSAELDCVSLRSGFDYIELMGFAMRCGVLVRQRLVEYVFPSALPAVGWWDSRYYFYDQIPIWVVFTACSPSEAVDKKLVGYSWSGRDLRIGAVMGINN